MAAMNTTRLLLLEDDPVSLAFLREALAPLGAIVATACDCTRAMALAQATDAAWLLDACLPDGSGIALLQALRARGMAVPALALTADPEGQRAALHAAGFLHVLPKPIDGLQLRAAVLAATAGSAQPQLWDDARALPALAGRLESLEALRRLFLAELRGQLARVSDALAQADHAAARAELHRLSAGCGFVGATRLREAAHALHAEPGDAPALDRFLQLGERQLAGD
jgi:CheY-like chemotaxis protein